jgi:hypothetical protein
LYAQAALAEEEEMPVSGGGSSSSAPEFCRDLLPLGHLEIKGALDCRREGEVLREMFGAARFFFGV